MGVDEEKEYLRSMEEKEREARAEYIQERRNKSRLSASHRQIVKGEMPYEGSIFHYNSDHMSKEHKRSQMSKYGKKQTGVEPGQCWPTQDEVQLAREWEQLYQEKPLKQMIEEARQKVEDAHQKRLDREKEGLKNLEAKDRMGAKTRMLDQERERREKVLEELRLEFGYVINPEDNYMKGRITERERVLIREEKEKKRQEKKEKELQRKAADVNKQS